MRLKTQHIVIMATVLILGGVLGWFSHGSGVKSDQEPSPVVDSLPLYKFINPVIFTETAESTNSEYLGLKKTLTNYVQNVVSQGNANIASIYFRDMKSGLWTAVNEDELYTPGSMLKVAVLLVDLRKAESDPEFLYQTLKYDAHVDSGQYYKPETPFKSGYYTVQQLLNEMIVDSDNTAAEVLISNDLSEYDNLYKVFQLPTPSTDPSITDFMSIEEYSKLLRGIYNARYLSSSVSDEALSILTHSNFRSGLVAGLPEGIAVAHKFGEHTNITSTGQVVERELHDCGIVYYPNKPYLLCVMTKGPDFPKLEKVISGASKLMYDYVKSN